MTELLIANKYLDEMMRTNDRTERLSGTEQEKERMTDDRRTTF
jgi:hypothetical protein